MKFNFKSLLVILSLTYFVSCDNQDDTSNEGIASSKISVEKLYDANSNLKRQFGKALMLSLKESKLLRDLIRNESLKMFDNDYDVLYQMIKDEKLENNVSVREIILKNIEDEDLLSLIELNNPALTIFVPELPENSFSAKLWDTENQIPKVAVRLSISNDVPVINQDGTEEVIEARNIPGYPIIVIKDNERVVVSRNIMFNKLDTRIFRNENNLEFKFLDDCFDKSKNLKKETSRIVSSNSIDPKIIEAYNMYANYDGWDRDYIYYGITPTSTKGPFKYDFQESIKSFTMEGNPRAAYDKIANQIGDPKKNFTSSLGTSFWPGGSFEFKIRIIVNGKNGVGSEIIKYFSATVAELFDLTYGVDLTGRKFTLKKVNGLRVKSLNIPIFGWDLNQYASTIKIDIEEVDFTETTVLTDSRNVEFATNFGLDVGFGTETKIGLKFGLSTKENKISTVQRTFTQGNDALGDVIVNFADRILIGEPSSGNYQTREYSSGTYSIAVEPVRVQ